MNSGSSTAGPPVEEAGSFYGTAGVAGGFGIIDPVRDYLYIGLTIGTSLAVVHGTTKIGTVELAENPGAAVYDAHNGFVYVGGLSTISVLNGTNTVAVLQVSSAFPLPLAYDPRNEFVYAGAGESRDHVEILNGTQVVANVSAAGPPNLILCDPSTGWVYVAEWGSVSILNGTRWVANLTWNDPNSVSGVYDPANGWVYLADDGEASLLILNGSAVVDNLTLPYPVGQLSVDTATGIVYGVTAGQGSLVIVNGTRVVSSNSTALTALSLGFDPGNGYTYVDESGPGVVSELMVYLGNHSIANVSLVWPASRLLYDPGTGLLWAISDGRYGQLVSTWLALAPPLLMSTNSEIDSGQPFWLNTTIVANGTGGLQASVQLPAAAGRSCPWPPTVSASTPGGSVTSECTIETTGDWPIWLNITDSSHATAWSRDEVRIYPPLYALAPNASGGAGVFPHGALLSVPVTLTADPTGGVGPYSDYRWNGVPSAACGGTQSRVIFCTFLGPSVMNISFTFQDTFGLSATSAPLEFWAISSPLVLATPRTDRSSVDVGQSVALDDSWSGGSGSFLSISWDGLPPSCAPSAGWTQTCTFPDEGTYAIQAQASDTAGETAWSPILNFSVHALPVGTRIVLSRPSVDIGQNMTLTAEFEGGSGPFLVNWTGLPSNCGRPTNGSIRCDPNVAGIFQVQASGTDASGAATSSIGPVDLVVFPDPSVSAPSVSVASVEVGQSVHVEVWVTGGSGNLSTFWGAPGCNGTSELTACQFFHPGSVPVWAVVTDGNGVSARSPTVWVDVTPAPASPFGLWELPAVAVILVGVLAIALWFYRKRSDRARDPGGRK
jgi:hypothetical protein